MSSCLWFHNFDHTDKFKSMLSIIKKLLKSILSITNHLMILCLFLSNVFFFVFEIKEVSQKSPGGLKSEECARTKKFHFPLRKTFFGKCFLLFAVPNMATLTSSGDTSEIILKYFFKYLLSRADVGLS